MGRDIEYYKGKSFEGSKVKITDKSIYLSSKLEFLATRIEKMRNVSKEVKIYNLSFYVDLDGIKKCIVFYIAYSAFLENEYYKKHITISSNDKDYRKIEVVDRLMKLKKIQ